MPELRNLEMGVWEGQSMRMVADRGGLPAAAATAAAGAAGPAVDPDSAGASAGLEDLGEFWYRTGVSIIDFPDGARSGGVMRCLNYTAHLGRWAVPITRDDMDMVCGIDGCF
ncbi:hypothetical protein OEZ86_004993 [Tetradesmus obliquus]|nr:hypothetical protein OEZ86_004993 [Tetradesmus obliquus]